MSRTVRPLIFGAATVAAVAALTAAALPGEAGTTKARTPSAATTRAAVLSDVSELVRGGVDINKDVLVKVPDDGDRTYLNVGHNGAVDFKGTGRSETTEWVLTPAKVAKRTSATKNRVVIMPSLWDDDAGPGSCLTDAPHAALAVKECRPGDASQTWHVVFAGDSGVFELHGRYTLVRELDGKIISGSTGPGYTGLETLPFAQ
jgi:hypothetical protein